MKMIRNTLFAAVLAAHMHSCSPAPNITASPATAVLSTHRTVAILPFEVIFANDVQSLKKFSDEEMKQLNQYFSLALQKHLASMIQSKQKRFPYSVSFQPPEETNQLLSSNKISFGAIFNGSKQAFCKLLNTDAVIAPQVVFGIKESVQDNASGGKVQMRFSIFGSSGTGAAWTYNRISNNLYNSLLANKYYSATPPPETVYGSDDKFEKMMLPWIRPIDELLGHFAADCPYKKKNNF